MLHDACLNSQAAPASLVTVGVKRRFLTICSLPLLMEKSKEAPNSRIFSQKVTLLNKTEKKMKTCLKKKTREAEIKKKKVQTTHAA